MGAERAVRGVTREGDTRGAVCGGVAQAFTGVGLSCRPRPDFVAGSPAVSRRRGGVGCLSGAYGCTTPNGDASRAQRPVRRGGGGT